MHQRPAVASGVSVPSNETSADPAYMHPFPVPAATREIVRMLAVAAQANGVKLSDPGHILTRHSIRVHNVWIGLELPVVLSVVLEKHMVCTCMAGLQGFQQAT